MQNAERTVTEKDISEKAMDLAEILDSMREDQRQLDRKIAELIHKACTIKGERTKER